jgi:hypothetical protein
MGLAKLNELFIVKKHCRKENLYLCKLPGDYYYGDRG